MGLRASRAMFCRRSGKPLRGVSIPSGRSTHGHNSSRFWAVLIGIDAYLDHPLHGCVSDVYAMKDYLIHELHIPENRIQCLLSPHPNLSHDNVPIASRANIVNTLLGLISNPGIQCGDNIIIYFSGHGSSYACERHADCPPDNVCGVEALCPSDRGMKGTNHTVITDITDRELNAILTQICHAKGRKITVILDCCYSSSLTRGPQATGVRSVPQLQQGALHDALRVADNNMRGLPGYNCVLDTFWEPDMNSHVVLAACGDHEVAREQKFPGENGCFNGVFTLALLRVLKSGLPDDLTYEDLLSRLPASGGQTPVIAGTYKTNRLWYRE